MACLKCKLIDEQKQIMQSKKKKVMNEPNYKSLFELLEKDYNIEIAKIKKGGIPSKS
jgi:hypothetical protein